MMPRIILFLLVASSPFLTLGDETESWGKLSSGPSESECRPYIEKALQGASIPDSTSQPGVGDDGGGTSTEENIEAQAEGSESHSSEVLSDSNDTQQEQGIEDQSTRAESDENESNEEPSGTVVHEEVSEISNEESTDNAQTDEESTEMPTDQLQSEESDAVQANNTNIDASAENEITELNTAEIETESIDEHLEEEAVNEASIEDTSNEAREIVDEAQESQESDNLNSEQQLEPQTGDTEEQDTDKTEDSSVSAEKDTEEKGEVEGEEGSAETAERQTSQEEIASNEEILKEGESETLSAETQEINDSSKETNEMEKEIEESSETLEKIDEQSEEATEKNVQEGAEIQPEQSSEEGDIPNQVQSEINVPEDIVESNETSQPDDSIMESENEDTEVPPESEEDSTQASQETTTQPNNIESPAVEESQEMNKELVDESKESTEAEQAMEEGREDVLEPSSKEESANATIEEDSVETSPEEELSMDIEVPEHLRSREHMSEILHLDAETEEVEKLLGKAGESTLRELKKLYDIAIKPLELLYKYRDLSNRHFGDPEIFSKPLILFMGPWSGGKSTIINYLLENEYKKTALRTGAEPSPAYFNIVMWGESEEVLDGTQLAADWTFSGLQKFGQGLLDRLRGLRLNHPLLEKVNIVEIPGILEIRKQVERLFPFNDACQWFIDRADIIFLVYDPSKLDVGPETEAILDQLKGREMQTRIILNKADQVRPEELMRVQGTLIWNISPLMSSTEPPVMYSTSLWSLPYESGAPARLLYAQEKAFLKDLRDAIDKRVENKIASARRFAVRVRNHAKMVDCYLTTYYNHKSFFGNKKKISDEIIEHPQNYHIYEGLSTLTNISRYDLPDPDVYRDFFRLNPVYEFQQLASTCTYFRGCPINRLDVAIAYDLPELVGKYKKSVDQILNSIKK